MSRKHRHNLISTEFHRTLIRIFCIQLKVWLFQHCCYVNSVRNFAFIKKKSSALPMKGCSVSGGSRIFLRGAPTPKVGVLTYYFATILPKTA